MSRIMSRPISMRAPPTAAEPAAFVRGLGGHGEAEEGGALVDALEQAEDEGAQAFGRRGVDLDHGGDGVQHGVVHRLEAGAEQLVAVGEVDVDGGAGDAGLGGDLVHGDLGRAALAEEAAGRVEDLVAPEVADDVLQGIGGAPGHGESLLPRARSARRLRNRPERRERRG